MYRYTFIYYLFFIIYTIFFSSITTRFPLFYEEQLICRLLNNVLSCMNCTEATLYFCGLIIKIILLFLKIRLFYILLFSN
jgi:hypothetical protein